MVAVISVDAYPFLTFSDLTCHLEDTGSCFLVALYCLIARRLNLEVAVKRLLSPSAGKSTRVVLVPCRAWKCVLTAVSGDVDRSDVPGCHLLRQMSSQ